MENAKDPDEYVLKFGPERFNKLIDNSISLVEYKVKNLQKQYNMDDISDKIKFLSKLSEILSKVESNIERDIYVDKFSRELNVGKEAIIAEIEKNVFKKDSKVKNIEQIKPVIDTSKIDKGILELENMIIYLLVQKDLKIYLKLSEVYSYEDSTLETHKSLIKKLYEVYETGDINNKDLMTLCETNEEHSILSVALIKETSKEDIEKLTTEIIRKIEVEKIQKQKNDLVKAMQNADTEEEKELLMAKISELITKLAKR